MVEPQEYVSGSTSVLCWLSELWKLSALSSPRENCACTGVAMRTENTNTHTNARKMDIFPLAGEAGHALCIRLSLWLGVKCSRVGFGAKMGGGVSGRNRGEEDVSPGGTR